MGTRRFSSRTTLLLVVGALFVATGCVAGSPLASLIAAGGTDTVSPLPSATTSAPSKAPGTSPGNAETPAPTRLQVAGADVTGHLTAGPTCPVEAVPPDPACASRPVAGATVIATDPAGHEVARAVSKADGSYSLTLAPGTYKVTPQPIGDHMMRAPDGKSVTLGGSAADTAVIDFAYDTGIR